MLAVETTNLGRVYRSRDKNPDIVALDGVSMQIEQGEIRGLLGPNGAGKTTLVKILATVLLPTMGSANVLGNDVVRQTKAVRRQIGIVFGGDRGLYWRLTGRQNLEYWAALYNVPSGAAKRRVSELLERVGLSSRADSRVDTYSRGMKQRLHLARGLVADAQVLFLDEPTVGMDPLAARDFRSLVLELRGEGRAILVTTHDMAEAEAICDQVALIDHGNIIATETPRSLSRLVAQYERIDFEGANAEVQARLAALPGIGAISVLPSGAMRAELLAADAAESALQLLVSEGVTSIQTSRPSLEEVYVHIMGDRGLEVGTPR